MTQLYIVRHAVAVEKGRGRSDAERPLTDRGRDRFSKAAKGFGKMRVTLDRMLHSPKVRAVQTAEYLAPFVDGDTIVTANLAKAPTDALLKEIAGERVAVVGHEPYLGNLAAWLVTGSRTHGRQFGLKKGGIMLLEGEPKPGKMKLVSCFTPKTLRALR